MKAEENLPTHKCIHIYFDHNFLQQMAHSKPYQSQASALKPSDENKS